MVIQEGSIHLTKKYITFEFKVVSFMHDQDQMVENTFWIFTLSTHYHLSVIVSKHNLLHVHL